ncbi:hypothetical protein [Chryseobacterium sp. JK1]|uniref:hypothetical protein n=1 Tax=Chryseobacterium sp. JK1 TaxID=874294 RepID=UPI003D680869
MYQNAFTVYEFLPVYGNLQDWMQKSGTHKIFRKFLISTIRSLIPLSTLTPHARLFHRSGSAMSAVCSGVTVSIGANDY